jgi:putative transposase
MSRSTISYKRHRFPAEIISHVVWLYYRFPLSLRHVEEMLLEPGIIVFCETIRRWGRNFGQDISHGSIFPDLREGTPVARPFSAKPVWSQQC